MTRRHDNEGDVEKLCAEAFKLSMRTFRLSVVALMMAASAVVLAIVGVYRGAASELAGAVVHVERDARAGEP